MSETREFHLLHLLEVCTTGDVPAGGATKIEKDGRTLAVFHLEDQYYVIDDACTHGPGSLSEGFVEGDVVECDFHNGAFNIRTGAVVAPPCMIPVRTYATHTVDGKIYIDPDQPAFGVNPPGQCPRQDPP